MTLISANSGSKQLTIKDVFILDSETQLVWPMQMAKETQVTCNIFVSMLPILEKVIKLNTGAETWRFTCPLRLDEQGVCS